MKTNSDLFTIPSCAFYPPNEIKLIKPKKPNLNWYVPPGAHHGPLEIPRPHLVLTIDICDMYNAHPHMEDAKKGHQ